MDHHGIRTKEASFSSREYRDVDAKDMFSATAFNALLSSPQKLARFQQFLEDEMSVETIKYWLKVNKLKKYQEEMVALLDELMRDYIETGSPFEINIESKHKDAIVSELPKYRSLIQNDFLNETQEHIYHSMHRDTFPRFVRKELCQSLAFFGRTRPDILESFCICDLSLPDCPMVMVSDGMVKLSGYSRDELLGANCRLLQGDHTDKATLANIAIAIQNNLELVELILNYRKDGTPFWNLLYISPLYNEDGSVRFVLGSQRDVTKVLDMDVNTASISIAKGSVKENVSSNYTGASSSPSDFTFIGETLTRKSTESATVRPKRRGSADFGTSILQDVGILALNSTSMPIKSMSQSSLMSFSHVLDPGKGELTKSPSVKLSKTEGLEKDRDNISLVKSKSFDKLNFPKASSRFNIVGGSPLGIPSVPPSCLESDDSVPSSSTSKNAMRSKTLMRVGSNSAIALPERATTHCSQSSDGEEFTTEEIEQIREDVSGTGPITKYWVKMTFPSKPVPAKPETEKKEPSAMLESAEIASRQKLSKTIQQLQNSHEKFLIVSAGKGYILFAASHVTDYFRDEIGKPMRLIGTRFTKCIVDAKNEKSQIKKALRGKEEKNGTVTLRVGTNLSETSMKYNLFPMKDVDERVDVFVLILST